MNHLRKFILITLVFSISFVCIPNLYGEPTEYDEEQDDIIENNTDAINDNTDALNDNTNSFSDVNENIMTNTNNISTLNDNAVLYDNDRNITLENDLTITGNGRIDGDLIVDGHIDPQSLELIPQSEAPIIRRGIIYYNDIDSEFKFRENGNWRTFGELDRWNTRQDQLLNEHDNRIKGLEKTQYIYEQEFRIIDTKKWELKPFIRTNFTQNKLDVIGIRATFKLEKSYEEKLITEQNSRIDRLEALLEIKTMNEIKTKKTNNGWKIDVKNSPTISVGKDW
jgi:hypothetical protein